MKKLFLIPALLCVLAMVYTGCKKDGVAPSKTTSASLHTTLAEAPDSSGSQNPPVLPPR